MRFLQLVEPSTPEIMCSNPSLLIPDADLNIARSCIVANPLTVDTDLLPFIVVEVAPSFVQRHEPRRTSLTAVRLLYGTVSGRLEGDVRNHARLYVAEKAARHAC